MILNENGLLGQNILRLRGQHRWSQRDLAERLHVHQTMVARWETGKATPRRTTLEKLSQVFEIPVARLISDATEQNSPSLSESRDPELNQMLAMVHSFETRDREALKTFLEAIVVKNRVKAAIQQAS